MASSVNEFRLARLSSRDAQAVKRNAQRLGLTTAEYLKQLVEDDLAIDRKAERMTIHQAAAPFRSALKGMGGKQIDALVSRARRPLGEDNR
jgi:hypothetical protein